jgi:hypothetical protein
MNKYDFIADLLEKEKLDSYQKERVIKLIVNELKEDGINQIEIDERLKQIEQKLISKIPLGEEQVIIDHSSKQADLPDYIDPSQLSIFLRAYNQDSMLKYTCHEIDADGLISINQKCATETFNLGKYQEQITNSFKNLVKQYSIPKNIWALINGYVNGGKEWSSDNIKLNWKSLDLIDWSNNNIGAVPNPDNGMVMQYNNLGFEFTPFRSNIFETTIGSFSQLVIHFKNLFHIRADNSLKRLIMNLNTLNGWDNQIEFSFEKFRDNIEFFTDVDKLLQAYKKIISIILDVSESYNFGKPNIELFLSEVDDIILFSIHHRNSTYKKTIRNTIERTGQKHTELIKKQINGICNLYIRADFENNEFARINLWNGEDRKAEMIEKFSGVEYQLIF